MPVFLALHLSPVCLACLLANTQSRFAGVVWHSSPTPVKIVRGKELLLFAGKSDIALQHAMIHPGGFMLEDTFLLVGAKTNLSREPLVMASLAYVPCQLQ